MMNKYQEALDRLNTINMVNFIGDKELIKHKDNDIKTLQELVDKETPIKPKIIKEEKYEWYDIFDGMRFYCPKCENELCCPLQGTKITRCDECGQKLDWSDE